MTEYRVTRKRVVRSASTRPDDEPNERVTFEEDDVFEPTDAELEAFGDRLEKVHYPSDGDSEEEDEEGN